MNESIELIGVTELLSVLDHAGTQLVPGARAITEAAGEELRSNWSANAAETSGRHGRFYPKSITAETLPTYKAAEVVVGPETSRKQGGMGPGFEYGSVNQPPHLDGKNALEAMQDSFYAQLELMAGGLL